MEKRDLLRNSEMRRDPNSENYLNNYRKLLTGAPADVQKPSKAFISILTIVLILALILIGRPLFTGLVTAEKEISRNHSINAAFDTNSEYVWVPRSNVLTGLKINGEYAQGTIARIYIENNRDRYLIVDTSKLNGSQIEDSSDLISNDQEIFEIPFDNINKTIALNLDYGDGVYDEENDGAEDITGVIDFTVANTQFSWDVDESKLCTLWDIYSVEDDKSTSICYGNLECCSLSGLEQSRALWNEPLYLTYNSLGATYYNIVSSKVVYQNESELVQSNLSSLNAEFEENLLEFSNECAETCTLSGFGQDEYTLAVEVDQGIIIIGSISYTALEPEENKAPEFTNEIGNLTVYFGKNATINLSNYFSDPDNNLISYSFFDDKRIKIEFEDGIATVVPLDFIGSVFTFITANDTEDFAISNIFRIEVLEPDPTLEKNNNNQTEFSADEQISLDVEFLSKNDLTRKGKWKNEFEAFEKKTNKTEQEIALLRSGLAKKAIQKNKWQDSDETLNITLLAKNQKNNIQIDVEELRDGKFNITIPKQRSLKPGKYSLVMEYTIDGVKYSRTSDFLWGVLAINFNKTIYLQGNDAFISIGVLDDKGKIVCNADVILEINSPSNIKTVLSTENGEIKVSEECEIYGVTSLPDYFGEYSIEELGWYTFNLTAKTSNGDRTLIEKIESKNNVEFDVSRTSGTRIYPLDVYDMNISIVSNRNFRGEIRDYVPSSFTIIPQAGMSIIILNDTKILSWELDLDRDERLKISYQYDAPDISPEFYLIGPLDIGSFSEARKWQIANDAPGDPNINASLDDSTPVKGQKVNMTANVSDDNGLGFCQFIDNQTLADGAKFYYNKSVSGTNDQCSQNYTIRLSPGEVINFTVIINDTSVPSQLNQSEQIITVASSYLIDNCSNLTVANTLYELTKNASSDATCMNVLANNITLDCHGLMINYSQVSLGYGVNITGFNFTTIRGCNITQADIAADTSSSHGIGMYGDVKFNSILNNTIRVYGTSSSAVFLTNVYNVSVYDNILSSSQNDGIQASTGRNLSLFRNIITTITDPNAEGITFGPDIDNGDVYQNNILTTGPSSEAIIVGAGSTNINVYNNIITVTSTSRAIAFVGSAPLSANIFNGTIYNNNVTTMSSDGSALDISNTLYLKVYDNNFTTWNNDNSPAILLRSSARNNTFMRNKIASLATGILINGSIATTGVLSSFNTFTNDTIVPCASGCSSDYADIKITNNATDNTFLNVSFNKSRIIIVPRDPSNPEEKNNITVKWYMDINITNSTNNNPIANAEVNINNSKGANVFNGLTSITGGITTQIVTEFEINGSSFNGTLVFGTSDTCNGLNNVNVTCYTPYNISVNLTGYDNNNSALSVNRSKLFNLSLAIFRLNSPIIKINNASGFTVNPIEGGTSQIWISFNITHQSGISQINATTAKVNLTLGGIDGLSRFNVSNIGGEIGTCLNHTEGAVMVINCTVNMYYYDNASSSWRINVSISDVQGNIAYNDTFTFTYNTLSAFQLSHSFTNFSNVNIGQNNILGYPHLILNNTGNDVFDQINVTAANLVGTTITSEIIPVTSFTANTTNSSSGLGVTLATTAITLRDNFAPSGELRNATLYPGHTSSPYTISRDKGNLSVFFWVDVPSGISAQAYNATWNFTAINLP